MKVLVLCSLLSAAVGCGYVEEVPCAPPKYAHPCVKLRADGLAHPLYRDGHQCTAQATMPGSPSPSLMECVTSDGYQVVDSCDECGF